MTYSVAFTSDINEKLINHLLRDDGQEDLCFALWYPSSGENRISALIFEVILPNERDRNIHGNASFMPEYFERVISAAMEKGAGIAFLHSHLGPGWQDMSIPDIKAEQGHAAATFAVTGFPLIGLTLGTDGSWSARFWKKDKSKEFNKNWCRNVRVIGNKGLEITYDPKIAPPPGYREELKRTISAWGITKQQDLSRLKVGVVGVGSVGSIVAEALSRMGIQHVLLMDFDKVERHNLDRILHSTRDDADKSRDKVVVVSHGINGSATAEGFIAEPINMKVTEENGYRKILDCDIIFSCVDRPWARSVLNRIAYIHLIPVIDGGIMIKKTSTGEMGNADWKAHIAMPTRKCLECLGQYDPALVQAEREGYLDDPMYIESLNDNHDLKNNQNVFPFSLNLASLMVMQMLSLVIKPLGISNAGEQNYHFISSTLDVKKESCCDENCLITKMISKGDTAVLKL